VGGKQGGAAARRKRREQEQEQEEEEQEEKEEEKETKPGLDFHVSCLCDPQTQPTGLARLFVSPFGAAIAASPLVCYIWCVSSVASCPLHNWTVFLLVAHPFWASPGSASRELGSP